jgi:hypothetical protein
MRADTGNCSTSTGSKLFRIINTKTPSTAMHAEMSLRR